METHFKSHETTWKVIQVPWRIISWMRVSFHSFHSFQNPQASPKKTHQSHVPHVPLPTIVQLGFLRWCHRGHRGYRRHLPSNLVDLDDVIQASWWFQPSWKISVKMGIFPNRDENKKYLSCHHLARDWKWFEGNFRSFEVILFSDFVQGKIMSFDEFSTTKKSDMSIRRCQFLHHFGPGAPGAEEPKKLRFWCCYVIQYVYSIGSWKPQTTNLKWMEMVKQPFKTACLEFQVLIFFRSSYTSSQTSCKKTYTEKKYQIWCQYFRSNHEKGFLEPFQVRIAPQTWGQMIRIFQVWNMNSRRWSNLPINIWKCRSCTLLTKLLKWNST